MSVTISIEDNCNYCREHNLVQIEEYECSCVQFPREGECFMCHGTGKETFEVYPFDMNLANGNFHMLWNALALPFDYSGCIDARIVRDALKGFDIALLIRDTIQDGNVINCGVDEERAVRYIARLTEIVDEAERRERKVCWG